MRHLFSAIFLTICVLPGTTGQAFSQTANFTDGFEDGDFTNNPTWTDSESKFIVNGSKLLQLNDSGATSSDEAVISTPSTAAYGEWEALIKLDFNPSGSNLAKFYVLSNTRNMKGEVNGYYVQVGGTDDEVSLYRQDGNSSTKIIDGTDGLVDNNPVAIRIKVTRDINGHWQLLADSTGGTSYISQETVTDSTYANSSFIGLFCDYTSTRSTRFQFDDISVTKQNPPLSIQNLAIQNRSTFDVSFNIDIAPSSIEAADFSINNGAGSPALATVQPGNQTIRLNYNNALAGGQYTLTVNNIENSSGNTVAANSALSFTLFDTFTAGDVIINEFVYDPANNQSEYVELKNTTGKYLNLQNWQLGDESGNDTISSDMLTLQPNGFLVISDDTTTLASTYGLQPYVQPGSVPAFNNSGDVVKVLTGSGDRVDSLWYNNSWGGHHVALERRSDSVPSIDKENFGDSPNTLGGTPGQANEITDDATPPDLTGLAITNDQTLELNFTERLAGSTATDPGNYTLDNGIYVSSATQTAGDSLQLSLSGPLQNGVKYHLSIVNQQDIFSNTAATIDTTFNFYVISPPDSGDIFINEFMYAPPDGYSEYIELYNPTSRSFDLNGWTINDNRGNATAITNSPYIVPPDSFVVIAPDNSLQRNYPDILLVSAGTNFPSLNNGGDAIVLRDSTGQRLDSLTYTSGSGGNEVALERRTTDVPPAKANFGKAPNGFGTPGSANKIEPDKMPPVLQSFTLLTNQLIQFVFTENITVQSATNTENYDITSGLSVSNATLSGQDTVQLSLSGPLQNNTSYISTIDGVKDLFGNVLTNRDTSFTYYQPSRADSGDVFINEFTYDPPDQGTEYVELYNTSSKSLDLNGWTLNDNSGNRQVITSSSFIIPPDSFVVIAPNNMLLNNYPDIALISMTSRFPSLNNDGDNIIIRSADGRLLDSLSYTPAFGGGNIAVERRTTNASSVEANFGDAPNGFGTPGSQNQIGGDTIPPHFINFAIRNNTTLKLTFSEDLKNGPAVNSRNYTLNHNISVKSSTQTAGDNVLLSLDAPLQNAVSYQLTIQHQQDIFGNTAATVDTTFTYYRISPADSGDVFINEFTYDPPEGSTEYIELYNSTSHSFDLKNWTLNDNTGNRQAITRNPFIIPPDSFVVIAPDQTLLKNNPDIPLVSMHSRFPSLNNSGDDIVLRDSTGQLLDSLRYINAWGGNSIALERRTINIPAVKENFGDAPDGFGTPGKINNIQLDNNPPTLHTLQILDNSTVRLILSEAITGQTATDENNYHIIPKRNIQLISAVQDTVTLFLSQQLQSGQNYQIEVSGLKDVFGNAITETTQGVTFVQYTNAQPGSIVINEILYRRESAGDPEFIELYNPTNHNYRLTDWQIGDAGSTATIDTDLHLRAGEYAVLTGNASFANSLDNAVYLSNFPSLNDDGDAVYIQDNNNITIDSLFYHARTFGGNTDGKSAERKDPSGPSNDASNFATSTVNAGSTPGAKNSVFKRDDIPPTIKFARILPDGTIAVYFSEFIVLNRDVTFSINDEPLSVVSFDPHKANIIILHSPDGINSGSELTLKARNLTDVKGNTDPSSTPSAAVAHLIKKGTVVINEILYDPINDSDDNQPDQSEYIELRNTQDYTISLEGVNLHDAPDENGDTHVLMPVSTDLKYIPPGGTALIYAGETSNFMQSRIAKFFSLPDQSKNTIMRIDHSTLSLASSGDAIYLAAKNGSEIDSVFYDKSWQNQNLADTKGIALERINPGGPSNDASNWGSSTDKRGGTPNEENTIYQAPVQEQQQDIGIHFSPNPFSPDDDGTDDRLFINYKLDDADYLITVDIYDRYGRLVRELADGKPAGFTGSLIWDGLKDNGTRNRIGIYIVIFKAFNSAEGKNKAFKKTVVLARRFN